MKRVISALSALAFATLPVESADATTLFSTKLSDIVGFSRAVVQGELISTTNLIDPTGTPWTIYTLYVARVLAGEVKDQELAFRCVGGTYPDGTFLELVGTPRFAVGDSIVAFIGDHPVCQLPGLEYGVLWLKQDADGIERVVDYRGNILGAMSQDDAMFSHEVVAGNNPMGVPESASELIADPDVANLPPPAPAETILDELEAFSVAYLTSTEPLDSTTDLKGIQDFTPQLAPAGKEESK